jgi:hypothetical protein
MLRAHLAAKQTHHKAIDISTYGIIYLGTPHQGANGVDLATLLLGIQSIYSETNDVVLRDLRSHSPALQQQLAQYSTISSKYDTRFFFEVYETVLFGGLKRKASRFLMYGVYFHS